MTATYDPLAVTAYHESGHCIGYLHYGWKFRGVRIYEENGKAKGACHDLSPAPLPPPGGPTKTRLRKPSSHMLRAKPPVGASGARRERRVGIVCQCRDGRSPGADEFLIRRVANPIRCQRLYSARLVFELFRILSVAASDHRIERGADTAQPLPCRTVLLGQRLIFGAGGEDVGQRGVLSGAEHAKAELDPSDLVGEGGLGLCEAGGFGLRASDGGLGVGDRVDIRRVVVEERISLALRRVASGFLQRTLGIP